MNVNRSTNADYNDTIVFFLSQFFCLFHRVGHTEFYTTLIENSHVFCGSAFILVVYFIQDFFDVIVCDQNKMLMFCWVCVAEQIKRTLLAAFPLPLLIFVLPFLKKVIFVNDTIRFIK